VVSRPPDLAVMALLRLLGLALGAYLLVVFGLGLALRLLRLRTVVAGVDRITPTTLRAFLDRVTGVAAAGAVAVASVAATAGPVAAAPGAGDGGTAVHAPPSTASGPPVTLRGLPGPQPDPTPTTTTTMKPLPVLAPPATLPPERHRVTPRDLRDLPQDAVDEPPGPDKPVAPTEPEAQADARPEPPTTVAPEVLGAPVPDLSRVPVERRRITSDRAADGTVGDPTSDAFGAPDPVAEPSSPADETAVPPGAGQASPADTGNAPVPGAPSEATWEVEVGDHFWSIAERTLAAEWGRQPSASEVDPYWRDLIQRNRSRLVDPANADLLLPGQVLVLPPVPLRPAA
jgi:hypothetical protein